MFLIICRLLWCKPANMATGRLFRHWCSSMQMWAFCLLFTVILFTASNCSPETAKCPSDPQNRLFEWRDCYPFCCTAWSCPVPSSCACRLCAKHSKLLKPDVSQIVWGSFWCWFWWWVCWVHCLFLIYVLNEPCSDIPVLAVVWSRW